MAGYPSFNADTDTAGPEHYRFVHIPKTRRTRSGQVVAVMEQVPGRRPRPKKRKISVPCPDLKQAQRRLLRDLYQQRIGATQWAHAYVRKRGIRTNALPHANATAILTLDLKDFFPSITPTMVHDELSFVLRRRRLKGHIIDTDIELLDRVKRLCFVDGGLPQGSPVSPFLSNVVGARIDHRIARLLRVWRRRGEPFRDRKTGRRITPMHVRVLPIKYTRYCDDLTFSSSYEDLWRLQFAVIKILNTVGLQANPDKIRLRKYGGRMTVCGIVVNQGLSTPRPHRRALRSRLHRMIQAVHHGEAPQGFEVVNDRLEAINFEQLQGLVAHTNYVNPTQGNALRLLLDIARDVHTNRLPLYTPETVAYLKL